MKEIACPNCGHKFSHIKHSQGAKAVRSGGLAQDIIETHFKRHGIIVTEDRREFHRPDFVRKDRYLIKQYKVNGHRIDYVFRDYDTEQILSIEVKNQNVGGTTDEKVFSDLKHFERQDEIANLWIVLYGDGKGNEGSFRSSVTNTLLNDIKRLNLQKKKAARLIFGYQLQRAIAKLADEGTIE